MSKVTKMEKVQDEDTFTVTCLAISKHMEAYPADEYCVWWRRYLVKDTWTGYVEMVMPFLQSLKTTWLEVRRMDIKNHNKGRKKPVMENWPRIATTAVYWELFDGFPIFGFVSKTFMRKVFLIWRKVFHQSDNLLRELTDKNLTYLHMWGENLQNTSSEDEIVNYIKKAGRCRILRFLFLSADGITRWRQGNRATDYRKHWRSGRNDVIAMQQFPESLSCCFCYSQGQRIYQGFEYDAIAIAYENSDIVDAGHFCFQWNAQSFVVHPDGRVVVDHSSESWGMYNFFGVWESIPI